VKDATIRGLTIRDAAFTYLGTSAADVHYLPSASDWTIQRSGAVLIEGTEGFVFARYALVDRNLHSMMPLVPTPARFTLSEQAYDQ
jgi:hypothetical protein